MGAHPAMFPFGQPSTARPPRTGRNPSVFLLGVYPSALHVEWTPPPGAHGARRITALAVDVEPTVFWDGSDVEALIEGWKRTVRFTEEDGSVRPARLNGSSGVTVRDDVLAPLGVTFDDVWLTDAVPWFFAKHGKGQQGETIRSVYDPWATATGRRRPSTLPARPTIRALVAEATTTERPRLLDELRRSGAETILTLGEEARRVVEALADEIDGPPARRLTAGADAPDGTARIDGRTFQWHALRHPGLRNRPTRR